MGSCNMSSTLLVQAPGHPLEGSKCYQVLSPVHSYTLKCNRVRHVRVISFYFCIILGESAIKQYITVMIDMDPSTPNSMCLDGFLVSSAMVAILSKPP